MFSRRLDPDKPLWELWLVEGLAGDRFALVSKVHHALVDGVAAVDPLTALFEDGGDGSGRAEPWEPRPAPTPAQLAADAVGGAARTALSLPFRAAAAAARPAEAAARDARRRRGARRGPRGAARARRPALAAERPASARTGASPSPTRRWPTCARSRTPSAARSTTSCSPPSPARCAPGCTTAGCGRPAWSCRRACRSPSPRTTPTTSRPAAGSSRSSCRCPSASRDPVERLRLVRVATAGLKRERHALGAEVLAGAEGFAPPTVLARAARLAFATRAYNVLVANVPGPQASAGPARAADAAGAPRALPGRGPRPGGGRDVLRRRRRRRAHRRLRRPGGRRRGRGRPRRGGRRARPGWRGRHGARAGARRAAARGASARRSRAAAGAAARGAAGRPSSRP